MKQDWSAYRITLLLYLGVLILPFSFYYTYSAMQDMTSDTTVIHQLSQAGGEMLAFEQTDEPKERAVVKSKIDENLKALTPWFASDDRVEFYVGGRTLAKDYARLLSCWETLKDDPRQKTALDCWKSVKLLSFTVDKMLLLKQKKIENYFYVNTLTAVIFLLLLIFMVRSYIYRQHLKHAIHDHETKLFNKKYFLSELHSTFDRSLRYEYPLSLISVTLNGFTNKTYDKKTKIKAMQELGELFTAVTRNSDIACKYDENHIAVLLPLTDKKHALVLENRLKEALEDHDFGVTPKMKFSFKTVEADAQESEEAFIASVL